MLNEDFFTLSPDLLCVAGFDGYFRRLNPAWTTALGWPLEELMAKPFLDFVHADDREATKSEVARLAAGTVTIRFENRYRHLNGTHHWLQWSARQAPGHALIYATARDITLQRRLEASLAEAEEENQRIKRELHDGLCQTLAGIAALGTTLSRKLAAEADDDASAAAAEIATLLKGAIGEARDLAHGLNPLGLKNAGLAIALEDLARTVQYLFRVSCPFLCDVAFPRLDGEVETHVYRIAQEALNNAVSHGQADRIDIGLSIRDGRGFLSVQDNGVGLSVLAVEGGGTGLLTMQYRARAIGAQLEIRQNEPGGTMLTCAFPMPERADSRERPDNARENSAPPSAGT